MAKFVLTAQIALQAPRNTSQVVNQIRKQLQGINVNINVNANTRALNNTNNQLNTTAKSAQAAEKSISELGKSLGIAARRFGAIAIATGTFLSLSRAIKTSLGDAIEFERQLVNLSQVTGKTVKDLKDISGEITRLSTGLGVSSDQLLRTSIILAQAGLEAGKTKAALEVLAKTTLAASFDDIESTTEGAIAVLSQFRREAIAAGGDVAFLEQALGAINDVSKKFAVESADLVAVIRRSGGAFEAAGGSLNELLALFTSVRATTRESAETIATGLRTIFTRIQRVDTIRQLQELGIALQDAEGKFVGPFEAIKRISEGLSGLDPRDFRFAAIVEELGGFRQIGKVIPLIKQFAVAQDALNTAQGASGSLAKDAATAQQSLANEFARVREEFQALIRKFVDSESFNTVARGAFEVARALIRITDALEPLLPLIAGLAAFQVGKGLIPALGALSGVTRRNQGGKIHAFASGGFVPGTGNRDTVPAMMTPGEFVIRKSSVKKIGAENLQKLNKGGTVQNIWDTDRGNIAAATLEDEKMNPISTSMTYKDSIQNVAKSRGVKLQKQYQIDRFSISKNLKDITGQKLKENILDGAQAAMEQTASLIRESGLDIQNPLLDSSAKDKFSKSIGIGTIGAIFEAIIASIKDPKFTDVDDQQRPFDFIGGIGKAGSLFDSTLANINSYRYIDAKATKNAANGKSFKRKIQGQVERELLGISGSSIQGKENPLSQIRGTFSKAGLRTKLQELGYSATSVKAGKIDKVLESLDINKYASVIPGKQLGVFTYTFRTPQDQQSLFTEEFAKGGASSDTAPAMLTPGEFVVNKQKAQEIGYSTLHKMNKTGKIPGYAKGGVVGYASGGPVTPTANTGMGPPSKNIMAFEQVFARLAQQSNGLLTSFQVFELAVQELTAAGIDLEKVEKFRYKQIQQDVRSRAAQEKILIDGYMKQQQALATSNEKFNSLKSGISKALGSMQQFVFLGSTVGALAAQFSFLDKASADALTETLGMASAFIATVGTVGDLILSTGAADFALKYFTKSVYGAAAANSAGSKTGGVTGILPLLTRALINPWTVIVGLIVGALAGAIYFFESRARKAAENLVKASDDILQAAEQGKGGSLESFVNTRLQATAAAQQAPSYIFTGEAEKQAEIKATKDSATALYNMTVSSRLLEERLAAVEKNASFTSLEKSVISMGLLTKNLDEANKTFTDSSRSLRNLTQGTKIEDLSGQTKTSAEAFDKAIKIAQERMSSVLLINSQALQQATEESIKNYDFGISGDAVSNVLAGGLQKILDTANNNIAQQAEAQARQVLEGARGKSAQDIEAAQAEAANIIQQAAKAQANNEINIKSQIEAAQKQANSSALITNALIKQREEIQKANGAIKFFASTLEKVSEYNKALESFNSRLSGGISTASVSGVQGIGNLNEIIDPGVFAKQLDKTIAPLGEFGKDVSKNLNSTAVFLDRARKKLLNVRFGETDVQATINELFDGVDISGELRAGITGLIQDAAKASSEGGSTIVESEFENLISPLKNQSEPFRKVVDGLINSQNELISANFSYLTEINKIRQEEIDGQRKLVDIENRLQDRLATVAGKSLSIQQKEAARNARRGFRASDRNSLINNFRSISDAIRTNADAIKKANQVGEITKLQKAQAGLSLEFNNLKGIMEELADQSERASDVMSEIDKERGKRETFGKIVESFVIGGQKERVDIVKQFQGLEFAALTGSFQGLGEEQRKATFGLLDQLASVDDRFKALKQNLLTADAIRAGFSPDAAIAIATQTPKEEKLINELRAIANEEKIFQRVLNENRSKDQKVLLDEFGKLSQEIAKFPNNLKNAISQAMTDARKEQEKIDANKITAEAKAREAAAEAERKSQIDANLRQEAENKKHKETMVKMQGLIDALDREREYKKSEMEKNIANLFSRLPKSEQNRIKNIQQKSTGGVVYRASGGSIFKPKGTDTVPAMLTPGEFVMRKAAVDKYGAGFMESINSGSYGSSDTSYVVTGGKIGKSGVSYFDAGGIVDALGRSFYEVLGVSSDASMNEITKAYRKASVQYHPDLVGNDPIKTSIFKFINDKKSLFESGKRNRDLYDQRLSRYVQQINSQKAKAPQVQKPQVKPSSALETTPRIEGAPESQPKVGTTSKSINVPTNTGSPKVSNSGLLNKVGNFRNVLKSLKPITKLAGPALSVVTSALESMEEVGYGIRQTEKQQGKTVNDLSALDNTKIVGQGIARGIMKGMDPSSLLAGIDSLQSMATGRKIGIDDGTFGTAVQASREYQNVMDTAQGAGYRSGFQPFSPEYSGKESAQQSSINALADIKNELDIVEKIKKTNLGTLSGPEDAKRIMGELNSIEGFQSSIYSSLVGHLIDYVKFSEQLKAYDQYGNPERYGPESAGGFSDNPLTNYGSKVLGMTTKFDAIKAQQEMSARLFREQIEDIISNRSSQLSANYAKESEIYDLNYKVNPSTGLPIKPEDGEVTPITLQEYLKRKTEQQQKTKQEKDAKDRADVQKTAELLGKDPVAYEKELEDHVKTLKENRSKTEKIAADFRKKKDEAIIKYGYDEGKRKFEEQYGEGSFYDQQIFEKGPSQNKSESVFQQEEAQVKKMEAEILKTSTESAQKDIMAPLPIAPQGLPTQKMEPLNAEPEAKIMQELGGTYGKGRHYDPQKQLALGQKRREQAKIAASAPPKQRKSIMQINAEKYQAMLERQQAGYQATLERSGMIPSQAKMDQILEQAQYQQELMQTWSTIKNKYNNMDYWTAKAGGNKQSAMRIRDSWYKELQQFPQSPETLADPNFQNILYRAIGGSIFKPKGTDTVPAMLTPGEFVMQKSSVDKYGVDTMHAINNGTAPAPMSTGGTVYRKNGGPIYARYGGPIGGPDTGMGSQIDMGPLMQLNDTFKALAGVLNNMQMTHQVNVDGSLNINGVNAPQIAQAVQQYLGEFIVSEVKKVIDQQGKGFKQG